MKNYVSYNKMSKKAQKAENNKKRNLWTVNPTTKVVPDKTKVYNRQKFKKWVQED